jgi:hypothetical protein
MRTLVTIMFALLSATVTPSKAPAKSVVAGHPLKLSFFNSPQHGHLNVKKIMDFPSSTSPCHGV